ncbi:hypothetical protein QR680_015697 [Steinernema hermaphroditum]|uniref:Uncharacterized protein n=1 Tax=Steinernema hermaphroditum TaxID=289476 RepID=A0AA39LKP3_9BILA|nr:hypothetical protein QR680_015697 [Steinernema hermaphroditum]
MASAQRLLFLLIVVLIMDGTRGETNESQQAVTRFATREKLVHGRDRHGDTILIASLVNISMHLSGKEADELDMAIMECNETSNNVSFTSDEVIVFCSDQVHTFFQNFSDVNQQFLYTVIDGWGDFNGLFQVAIQINVNFTENVIMQSNGTSELEMAIEEFIDNLPNNTNHHPFEVLLAQINETLMDEAFNFEDKMANISAVFFQFFRLHLSFRRRMRSIVIREVGSLEAFLDVADQFFRVQNFGQLFVIPPGKNDSVIVLDLTKDVNNPTFNLSRSEKTVLLDFIDDIRSISKNKSLSVQQKVTQIVFQRQQLLLVARFLEFVLGGFPIGGAFGFGTFVDLLNAFDFNAVFTSTQGNCGDVGTIIKIFNGNMTIFYQSSKDYLDSHKGPQATTFRPYLIRIQQTIILNKTLSVSQKIRRIAFTIKTYIGKNQARANFLYAIQIGSWGSYKQLQTCGGF